VRGPSRITGALATECPTCRGIGYTPDTAPEMHTLKEVAPEWVLNFRGYFVEVEEFTGHELEYETQRRDGVPQLGSGCPRCLGTGQLARPARREERRPR
jgi:hypothetical protein